MRANPTRAVFLVLFSPSRFVEAAVAHDLEREWETNAEWRAAYPDRKVPEERVRAFRDLASQRTSRLRSSVAASVLSTVAAIIAGLVAAAFLQCLAGAAPHIVIAGLQVTGAGILLGATLAEVGRGIESWKQQTLAEMVNRWVFRTLYVLGTFILVLSVSWTSP